MKDSDVWIACQQSLIYCCLENSSAVEFLPKIFGGQYGENSRKWEDYVRTFIYQSLKKDLLEVVQDYGLISDISADGLYKAYSCASLGNEEIWMGIQFSGTSRLIAVLRLNDSISWEKVRSTKEIKDLKDLFFE
ncbi:hypothetical protein ABIC63_005943 [Pseudacidovorax sp. 1753]|uniref:hypothetical protein n=1 Tax=Pseudacidovorax sp. 1753 TaxID=3156419 RepID=UPI0033921F81